MKKTKTASPRSERSPAAVLSLRIQPRASKNEIIQREGGKIKVRLTAPPVDGAANEALILFLSDVLGVTRSHVEIMSGLTSREKIIRIMGMSEADARRLLNVSSK